MYEARITFDDGPGPYTAEILAVLERHHLRATFFVNGNKVIEYAQLLRGAVADGHTIGNHSWDHADFAALDDSAIDLQLSRTNAVLTRVLGKPPTLFRPPFGYVDNRVVKIAVRLGLESVMWDVDCEDWKRPGVEFIAGRVAGAKRGEIVLLHDGGLTERSQTVAGLDLGIARALAMQEAGTHT